MAMLDTAIDAETGAATSGGRRPTVVAAPVSASPELFDRPRRRSFTAQDTISGSLRVRYQIESPIVVTNSTATITTAGEGRRSLRGPGT
jgi:hypothetical protein